MSTLGKKNKLDLTQRGISVDAGVYGDSVSFTSQGLCWLLNYLHVSGNCGSRLSLKILKELAGFVPIEEAWRELRVVAAPLPAYDTKYYQIIFYLNGSPPKAVFALPPDIENIPSTLIVPNVDCGSFKVRSDQVTRILLSESEVSQLSEGEYIAADR